MATTDAKKAYIITNQLLVINNDQIQTNTLMDTHTNFKQYGYNVLQFLEKVVTAFLQNKRLS